MSSRPDRIAKSLTGVALHGYTSSRMSPWRLSHDGLEFLGLPFVCEEFLGGDFEAFRL